MSEPRVHPSAKQPDDYWDKPCVSCSREERNHTNLECVTECAKQTGTPLDQAKNLFRPPARQVTEATVWTPYVQQYKYEGGEPE